MILILLIAIVLFRNAASAPVDQQYVSWQGETNVRGTWSILSSCVITLTLCVYTAVHMNVPLATYTSTQRRWHVVGWVTMGIFAPEIVLFTAWCQWSTAKSMTNEMKKFRAARCVSKAPRTSSNDDQEQNLLSNDEEQAVKSTKDPAMRLLSEWTMKHSFFVVMGGLQFKPDEGRSSHLPDLKTVLTPEGFLSLYRLKLERHIPYFSIEDLEDRSKADNLAKLLACTQCLWLIFQVAGRAAARFTISELEINTLGHVVCALFMYACWMNKPLNVTQPVWVKLDESGGFPYHRYQAYWIEVIDFIKQYGSPAFQSQLSAPSQRFSAVMITGEPDEYHHALADGSAALVVIPESASERLPYLVNTFNQNWQGESRNIIFMTILTHQRLISMGNQVLRRNLKLRIYDKKALENLVRIWTLPDRKRQIKELPDSSTPMPLGFKSVKEKPRMFDEAYLDDLKKSMTMMVVSSLYGGLHASIWHHHFPTVVEMWLWRLSSLVVAGTGLFAAVFSLHIHLYDNSHTYKSFMKKPGKVLKLIDPDSSKMYVRIFSWMVVAPILVAATLLAIVFCFCRFFLFVEAFLSLRSQPTDTYQTPDWVQWMPHL